jgi:hypothetical protein
MNKVWKSSNSESLAGFLLGLFFDLEDGSDMVLWNVSWLSMEYMALYARRWDFSVGFQFEI